MGFNVRYLGIMNTSTLFGCLLGNEHNWMNTGNFKMMYISNNTDGNPPQNTPKEYEQICSRCGVVKWTYGKSV